MVESDTLRLKMASSAVIRSTCRVAFGADVEIMENVVIGIPNQYPEIFGDEESHDVPIYSFRTNLSILCCV